MTNSLFSQLSQISPLCSSLLFWGEDDNDCDFQTMILHEAVLDLPINTRFNYVCRPQDSACADLMDFQACLPRTQEKGFLGNTLVFHDVHSFAPSQQNFLLKKIINKFDGELSHFRFIVITNSPSHLNPELNHYFATDCVTIPEFFLLEEVDALAEFVIERYFKCAKQPVPRLSLDAQALFRQTHWPNALTFIAAIERTAKNYLNDKSALKRQSITKEHVEMPLEESGRAHA